MNLGLLLGLLGCGLLAAASHALLKLADRRSRADYEAMLQALGRDAIEAVWFGGRPLVGWWGCGLVWIQLLRGLGAVGSWSCW
jgi:hypothetical protein